MEEGKKESEELMDWIEREEKELNTPSEGFEKKPSPKFEEGKITEVVVDASNPFDKWTDPETKKTKAIVPCKSLINGEVKSCNWWINIKNPIYKDVIHACRDAKDRQTVRVRIYQTGSGEKTRYSLVKG
jgi:hypothetical protein